MQFQITALGLAAILLPLTAAQAQFSCQKYVASNDLGKCQDAIKTLRGLEAKGCNIFGNSPLRMFLFPWPIHANILLQVVSVLFQHQLPLVLLPGRSLAWVSAG
jgi:hypothetical protein